MVAVAKRGITWRIFLELKGARKLVTPVHCLRHGIDRDSSRFCVIEVALNKESEKVNLMKETNSALKRINF